VIIAFLSLWFLYNGYAAGRNLMRRDGNSRLIQSLQSLLVLLALYWAWTTGILFRGLWAPSDVILALVLGHLIFALSLIITHQHGPTVLELFLDIRGLAAFLNKAPGISVRFFGVAVIEELIYRAAAQSMLHLYFDNHLTAILITSVCFCLLHDHFFKNGVVSALEFALFTLCLSVLYYYTFSLILVIVVHWVRNIESAYLDYCALLEDTHDEEEALRRLDGQHGAPTLEYP
jgi:membrane protease YdiL (CAAX protease family)